MKYFLIVGEASGDLHASHLMQALRNVDPDAEFHFYGGDLMSAVGGVRLKHYKEMAYMGFVTVLLHLPHILRNMQRCKKAIRAWNPDVIILVDYPGFNLRIAEYVHRKTNIPVYYYISPKIWAWKEFRIKKIRQYVDEMFSIFPFEIDFFEKKHHYPVHYVGNPTVDEIEGFRASNEESFQNFVKANGLVSGRPIIALLAGSRKQEIKDNLPIMCQAAKPIVEKGYQLVLAGAPNIDPSFYKKYLSCGTELDDVPVTVVRGMTYRLLQQAEAALVTSGTATLETALFRVPQVVCYHLPFGRFYSLLRRWFLKVPYISLVNLVSEREVVCELVAEEMTVNSVRRCLTDILEGGARRQQMLADYERMIAILGPTGAAERTAEKMVCLLKEGYQN